MGYKRIADAIHENVSDKFKRVGVLPAPCGKQKVTVINEAGLYKLAFKSHAKNAEYFTDWVASDVLSSIRKHTKRLTRLLTARKALGKLLMQAGQRLIDKDREIEAFSAELEVANKKANYVNLIIDSGDDITATQIAQDYGMSAVRCNKLMKELGVQRKVNN